MRYAKLLVGICLLAGLAGAGCVLSHPPTTPPAQVSTANATLKEKEAALKAALEQVRILRESIQQDKNDALKRKFGWLIALVSLVAVGFGVAAWFLPLFRKVAIKGVAACGVMICVLATLIKLTPYFNTIGIYVTVGMAVLAGGYILFHTKKVHDVVFHGAKL